MGFAGSKQGVRDGLQKADVSLTATMDEALVSQVVERLDRDTSLSAEAAELALAALLGEVDECLGGKRPAKPEAKSAGSESPVRTTIRSVSVEGFRGIGPRVRLDVSPGPGLTLVVGRNGSGKSSFAEALEFLLTGDNQRWSARRSKIWRDGWRNLHHPERAEIQAELLIEGLPGPVILKRTWNAGEDLEKGTTTLVRKGQEPESRVSLGWDGPMGTYRPFLSYNELGSMLEQGPSKLYDALAAILGLEDLVDAANLLLEARKTRHEAHQATRKSLEELRGWLEKLADERARDCLAALQAEPWDLDVIERRVSGEMVSVETDSEIALLRALSQIRGPDPDAVRTSVEELEAALAAAEEVAGTDADEARSTAEILEKALQLHERHGDRDCPVCGREGALDETWHADARTEITRLRNLAAAADRAHGHLQEAERKARSFFTPPPPGLERAAELGIDADRLLEIWKSGLDVHGTSGADLASRLQEYAQALGKAAESVREQAEKALQEREDAWRPVVLALATWLPNARRVVEESKTLDHLRVAEQWLRKTGTDIRNERFRPIKESVKAYWEILRTQSSVDLVDVTFEGSANARRVHLGVTVDGTEGVALGVMSQGELHSLALSLFLPRATLGASPFRFLFIDDPVQAMDPAKVDGLARVLDRVAQERQVVVFTHDDRLPQAVRYLDIEATIIEVQRREGSVIELRKVRSPVEHYLRDAMALAKTGELPREALERVVPGLCRQSLEAACLELIRRRRLNRGEPHEAVEALIEMNSKLLPRLALALFDDSARAGEVLRTLNNKHGRWAGDVVMRCNQGAHQAISGDSSGFVRDTEKLALEILEMA